jgi:spore germination cell wall hydrolase CwlJ-like protein
MIAALGATNGAAAEVHTPIVIPAELITSPLSAAAATPGQAGSAPAASLIEAHPAAAPTIAAAPTMATATSLAGLAAAQPQPASLSPELQCLAGAIYFESKGQKLAGQLAVGRVVVNRSKSGRFPGSYCGVVFQHAQFGFVRAGAMPAIPRSSQAWRTAVAVAQIADSDGWHSETEGALYFHAARVSPNWHRVRLAQLEDHIFYR